MAETIGSIYSNFLTEEFIKENIKNKKIPNLEEIQDNLDEQRKINPDFSSPFLNEKDFVFVEQEGSSAKKINNNFKTLYADLSVLYKALIDKGMTSSKAYNTYHSELNGLEKGFELMEKRVAKLLFESENSDLYSDLFYETFESKDYIDTNNSVIEFNASNRNVTIPYDTQTVINFNVGESDVTAQASKIGGIVSDLDLKGMEVLNIFSNQNKIWQRQVTTKENMPLVTLDLIVRVPNRTQKINKILIDPIDASLRSIVTLNVEYSDDKLNWKQVDGDWAKRLTPSTSISFKGISPAYFRFRFNKNGSDGYSNGTYLYNFGLKSIKFIGNEFKVKGRVKSGLFYSKIIGPRKKDYITQIGFASCNIIPDKTKLRFYLAPLVQQQIDLVKADGKIENHGIKFYQIDNIKSKDFTYLDTTSLTDAEVKVDGILSVDNLQYDGKGVLNRALNFNVLSVFAKEKTSIMRNKADNTLAGPNGGAVLVRGMPIGWRDVGAKVETIFKVYNPNGIYIDFGSTKITINGSTTSGKVFFKQGKHLISTDKTNWISIQPNRIGEGNPDPLYPYNHKYLIEGLQNSLYGIDLATESNGKTLKQKIDPENVYVKNGDNWEVELQEKEPYLFDSNKIRLDTFAYKVDNNEEEKVIINLTEQENAEREIFTIFTRYLTNVPV